MQGAGLPMLQALDIAEKERAVLGVNQAGADDAQAGDEQGFSLQLVFILFDRNCKRIADDDKCGQIYGKGVMEVCVEVHAGRKQRDFLERVPLEKQPVQ